MFKTFRFWLATKLVGRDVLTVCEFGGLCVHRAMYTTQTNYFEWQMLGGQKYITRTHEPRQHGCKVVCDICTHHFETDPDRPSPCPLCKSRSVSFAVGESR